MSCVLYTWKQSIYKAQIYNPRVSVFPTLWTPYAVCVCVLLWREHELADATQIALTGWDAPAQRGKSPVAYKARWLAMDYVILDLPIISPEFR